MCCSFYWSVLWPVVHSDQATNQGTWGTEEISTEVIPGHCSWWVQYSQLAWASCTGQSTVQQRSFSDWNLLSCGVPIQAAEGDVQNQDLPPQRGREGTSVSAHHQRRELEAGHKDRPSGQLAGCPYQWPRAGTPVESGPCRGIHKRQKEIFEKCRGVHKETQWKTTLWLMLARTAFWHYPNTDTWSKWNDCASCCRALWTLFCFLVMSEGCGC